mgnify:CR=1 FL=1
MARPPRALVPRLPDDASVGQALDLDKDTRHHLGRVLRLRAGETVELIDGEGGLASAAWTAAGSATLREQVVRAARPATSVSLAVAPPRPSRLDWLVEKAVELGLMDILLLQTEHTARSLQPKRLERLQRKADEALLQCRRLWRVRIHRARALDQVLAAHAGAVWYGRVPADAERETPPHPPAWPTPPRDGEPLRLVVGPEGGLSAAEQSLLDERGARGVCCGQGILRVETAALALAVLAGA